MNQSLTLRTAAFLGAIAVIAGASGAHGLAPMLEAMGTKSTFELASRYHFYHTLALLATGILMNTFSGRGLQWAAILFTLGILFFSGSLYLISFVKVGWIWPVTPLGGLCFISGWIALGFGLTKK